jgi:hypothetical protein
MTIITNHPSQVGQILNNFPSLPSPLCLFLSQTFLKSIHISPSLPSLG